MGKKIVKWYLVKLSKHQFLQFLGEKSWNMVNYFGWTQRSHFEGERSLAAKKVTSRGALKIGFGRVSLVLQKLKYVQKACNYLVLSCLLFKILNWRQIGFDHLITFLILFSIGFTSTYIVFADLNCILKKIAVLSVMILRLFLDKHSVQTESIVVRNEKHVIVWRMNIFFCMVL